MAGLVATGYLALAQEASTDQTPPKPVPVESSTAKINAKNTRVEFVGLHTGRDPKPRLGGFREFDGVLVVEEDKLKRISVEIEIASIWTEFDKLTQHLQAADFLNAKEYPIARFQSTKIVPGKESGMVEVTGELDLHGTKETITFPAKISVTKEGIVLDSEFQLDRALFGMNDHLDGVEKLVEVHVVVGQGTKGAGERADKKQATRAAKPAADAKPPISGLAAGESVEPWTPVHVAGPDKGTRTCPVCTYLSRPAIVVFARQGANTDKLLAEVENLLAKHEKQKLKGFVTVLDATPAELEQLATSEGVVLTSLCTPDPKTGEKDLAAYNVNPKVENTVIIYKDYEVVATFVDLPADDADKLKAAVAEMLK
jgi:polyisoprenoid-binding protein YceI